MAGRNLQLEAALKELQARIDKATLCRFFDPWDGGGCMVPLPLAIQAAAEEMNGRTLQLRTALSRLVAMCVDDTMSFRAVDGAILLKTKDGVYPQHCWRVIRFERSSG